MIKGFVINYVKNILEFFALYLSMLFPRDRRTTIFGAWWGNKYDDNSKYLFEYVVKNRPDLNAVWLSDNDNVVKEIIKKGYPAYHSKSLKAILLALRVALAEAMYCYTPAVTFTIVGSGVNWVNLNGVTGIEVPNKDVIAYAQAIDKLLMDEPLAQKYGEAAHQRVVENFTIPKMMEKMNEVYDEVISM